MYKIVGVRDGKYKYIYTLFNRTIPSLFKTLAAAKSAARSFTVQCGVEVSCVPASDTEIKEYVATNAAYIVAATAGNAAEDAVSKRKTRKTHDDRVEAFRNAWNKSFADEMAKHGIYE